MSSPTSETPRPKSGFLRRWTLRLGIAALAFAVVLGIAIFLPLPVGWAINWFAPSDGPFKVHVEAATLRLLPGDDNLTLEILGLDTTQSGQPLATVKRVFVSANKDSLRAGRYLDSRVECDGVSASYDAAAWPASPAASPASDPLTALAQAVPLLPGKEKPFQVVVTNLEAKVTAPAGSPARAASLPSLTLNLHHDSGKIHASLEGVLASQDKKPLPFHLATFVETATGLSETTLKLDEFATTALPASLGLPVLPLETRLGLETTLKAKIHPLDVSLADLSLTLRDTRLSPTLHPLLAKLPPASLDLKARVTENLTSVTTSQCELSLGEGVKLVLSKLSASTTPAYDSLDVSWGVALQAGEQGRLSHWLKKKDIADLDPALRALLDEAVLTSADGTGSARLAATKGVWAATALELSQNIAASLGPTAVRLGLTARQKGPGQPVEVTLDLPEIRPADKRRKKDDSPLALLDLPISLRASAVLNPDGSPRDATLALQAGPGRLRAWGPLTEDIPVKKIVIEGSAAENATVFRLKNARFEAGKLSATADGAEIRLLPGGNTAVSGRLLVSGLIPAEWKAWLPPEAQAALSPLGWKVEDLALGSLDATVSVEVDAKTRQPASGSLELSATADVGGKPVPLSLSARLAKGSPTVPFVLKNGPFQVRDWPGAPSPTLAWQDFDFPIELAVKGTYHLADRRVETVANVAAGPGKIRLPNAARSVVQFARFQTEITGDTASPDLVKASGSLRLSSLISFGFEAVELSLGKVPGAKGRARLEEFTFANALAWWPANLEPELRQQALDALQTGRLTNANIDFDVGFPPGQPMVVRSAKGAVGLAEMQVRHQTLPGTLSVPRIEVFLDWPSARFQLGKLAVPGFDLSDLTASVANVIATPLTADVTGKFGAEVPSLIKLGKLPPGSPLAAWKGKLSGDFDTVVSMQDGLPRASHLNARVSSAGWSAPGVLVGDWRGDFSFQLDTIRHFTATFLLNGTDLAWGSTPAGPGLKLPAKNWFLSVETHLDQEYAPQKMAVSGFFPDFYGAFLKTALTAHWAAKTTAPSKVDIETLSYGNTRLAATFGLPVGQPPSALVTGPMIDVGELWTRLEPLLVFLPPEPKVTAVPVEPAPASPPPDLTALAGFKGSFRVDAVSFGPGRTVQGFDSRVVCDATGWPETFSLSATEGAANTLSLNILPLGPSTRSGKLNLRDISAWCLTLATPFWDRPIPRDTTVIPALKNICTTLGHGSLVVDIKDVTAVPSLALHGSAKVNDAILVNPPNIVRLLALKTGKDLGTKPVINELSIESFGFENNLTTLNNLQLAGPGLIDKLAIKTSTHHIVTDAIKVDGTYFTVGFEFKGTRADPSGPWLKDNNLMIQAIGKKDKGFFPDEDEPAKK